MKVKWLRGVNLLGVAGDMRRVYRKTGVHGSLEKYLLLRVNPLEIP